MAACAPSRHACVAKNVMKLLSLFAAGNNLSVGGWRSGRCLKASHRHKTVKGSGSMTSTVSTEDWPNCDVVVIWVFWYFLSSILFSCMCCLPGAMVCKQLHSCIIAREVVEHPVSMLRGQWPHAAYR